MAVVGYANPEVATKNGSGVSISPIPSVPIIPRIKFLLDGASDDMSVDGSVTPVDFEFAPGPGEVFYLEFITFGLDDTGNTDPDKYGAIAGGLTNGTQVILDQNTTEYEIVNLQNNGDIITSFNFAVAQFESGGFGNFSKGFVAKMVFATNITLKGDDNDKVIVRVRDDLSGLTWHRSSIQIWEEL